MNLMSPSKLLFQFVEHEDIREDLIFNLKQTGMFRPLVIMISKGVFTLILKV